MAQLIMYWDRVNPLGDPIADIEVLGNMPIEVPPNACGFRLGFPNQPWSGAWYFARFGVQGLAFNHNGIPYSSAFTGPSPDAISARGPVHGCSNSSGSYEFQTPLGQFGIAADEPVIAGAGSFVADFTTADDIEWLDHAGQVVVPEGSGPDPEKSTLPPEFFEQPPDVKGCFRDFDGELHCPDGTDTAAMAPGVNLGLAGREGTQPGIALLVAAGSGILPQVATIAAPRGRAATTSVGAKVEVLCPAALVLTATFYKDPDAAPAVVNYRFRFAHGPVSTVFTTVVPEGEAHAVFHSVPIPLPPPLGGPPSGGVVPSGPGNLAVYVRPDDGVGGGGSPQADVGLAVEALPDNEHKGSVRVEVTNAFEGTVTSKWVTYHMVCSPASHRPILGPGAIGASVVSLQASLNRWLRTRRMAELNIDGVFGPRTEAVLRSFQRDRQLVADGMVGARTWTRLLDPAEQSR